MSEERITHRADEASRPQFTMTPMLGEFESGAPAAAPNKSGLPLEADDPLAGELPEMDATLVEAEPKAEIIPRTRKASMRKPAGCDSVQPADAETDDDLLRSGFFPFYRCWRSSWWWTKKPWGEGQLFMHLLLDANRKSRTAWFCLRVIPIGRGCVATSVTALAKLTGWNRKRVDRFLRDMVDAGEIQVLQKGQHGILLKLLKYDTYALDGKKWGNDGAAEGAEVGQ